MNNQIPFNYPMYENPYNDFKIINDRIESLEMKLKLLEKKINYLEGSISNIKPVPLSNTNNYII